MKQSAVDWKKLALLLALAPGCGAMGMDRGPIEPIAGDAQVVVDDARIAEALSRRPQLPDRVRVGVWFRGPADGSWRWTFEERQRVIESAEGIDRVELFPISRGFVEGEDLASLRLAAARHGAHAVLILDGAPEQETSDNAWLVTYPLILPIFFAPAAELDTRFSIDAQMYDVRNGFLYLTAEAEALEEQQRAHVWIDHDAGVRVARERAVDDLRGELAERLAHLLADAAPASDEAPSAPEPEAPAVEPDADPV